MRYWKIFFLLLFFLSFPVTAMLQENLSSGDQTAQTFLNQMNQTKQQAGAHPFYQGISKEANYKDTELKGRGQAACAQNPAAQMVLTSSDARPQMKIDPLKDPLLVGSQNVMDNPLEIIGGKGTQVVAVQQGGKTENIICEESGEDSLETCTRELTVKVIKTKVRKEWNGAFEYGKCCNKEKHGHSLPCPSLRKAVSLSKRNKAGLNITQAYKDCMGTLSGGRGQGCSKGCKTTLPVLGFQADQIKEVLLVRDLNNPRKLLMKYRYFHEYGSGRTEYNFQPLIKIIYEEDSYEIGPDEWSDNCARLEERLDSGLCGYVSRVCTHPHQKRMIEGVPITKDCWQETMTYACSFPAKDDCGPLRARGCAQINSTCKQMIGNACVVYQQTYQCKDSRPTTVSIAGGDTPFCMDGNCRDQTWESNDELMSSVAQLSILKEMQGKLEGGFLFSGEGHQCSKYILSFKDCCGSGKGWGKDLGLGGCKAEAKLLNTKRKSGLCHRVGSYCAKKDPFGHCIKKKTSFCCFGSKLLKAFQEQGRAQIGMGWGSPEQPLCRGFTIAEIQRIDFSKLDLREVFEELMKNYKPGKIQGQDKKLQDNMNFPKLHNQGAFDVARKKYAPPPEGQNMGQKVGERLEIIKRGLTPAGSR